MVMPRETPTLPTSSGEDPGYVDQMMATLLRRLPLWASSLELRIGQRDQWESKVACGSCWWLSMIGEDGVAVVALCCVLRVHRGLFVT
jgi:hypothetical protein